MGKSKSKGRGAKGEGARRRQERLRSRLVDAMEEQTLLRATRAIDGTGPSEGYVVGVGRRWVLFATLDPRIHLDGWTALRLEDLLRLTRLGGPEAFPARALQARGEWPPTGFDVDLDDDAALLRTAGDLAPLVTLHTERDDPSVCFIGELVSVDEHCVTLWTVDTDAAWEQHSDDWLLRQVTRVDVLGGYEQALALVAPPRAEEPAAG